MFGGARQFLTKCNQAAPVCAPIFAVGLLAHAQLSDQKQSQTTQNNRVSSFSLGNQIACMGNTMSGLSAEAEKATLDGGVIKFPTANQKEERLFPYKALDASQAYIDDIVSNLPKPLQESIEKVERASDFNEAVEKSFKSFVGGYSADESGRIGHVRRSDVERALEKFCREESRMIERHLLYGAMKSTTGDLGTGNEKVRQELMTRIDKTAKAIGPRLVCDRIPKWLNKLEFGDSGTISVEEYQQLIQLIIADTALETYRAENLAESTGTFLKLAAAAGVLFLLYRLTRRTSLVQTPKATMTQHPGRGQHPIVDSTTQAANKPFAPRQHVPGYTQYPGEPGAHVTGTTDAEAGTFNRR